MNTEGSNMIALAKYDPFDLAPDSNSGAGLGDNDCNSNVLRQIDRCFEAARAAQAALDGAFREQSTIEADSLLGGDWRQSMASLQLDLEAIQRQLLAIENNMLAATLPRD
ncbi:MAG: hypothetical protein ACKV0T_21420 [Planctomycetales bacterium]